MDTKELSEKALLALKFDTDLRKYCVEMAIYSLGADENNVVEISVRLEQYILNGKTATANKASDY